MTCEVLNASSNFKGNFPNWNTLLLKSIIGEGNGTRLQYSCLENPTDGGAWWAAVHGVAKSRTQLSNFTFTFHFHALEKEMATHSSVLAWRIPGTAEPGGLPSLGLQSRTRLKQHSSSSKVYHIPQFLDCSIILTFLCTICNIKTMICMKFPVSYGKC